MSFTEFILDPRGSREGNLFPIRFSTKAYKNGKLLQKLINQEWVNINPTEMKIDGSTYRIQLI